MWLGCWVFPWHPKHEVSLRETFISKMKTVLLDGGLNFRKGQKLWTVVFESRSNFTECSKIKNVDHSSSITLLSHQSIWVPFQRWPSKVLRCLHKVYWKKKVKTVGFWNENHLNNFNRISESQLQTVVNWRAFRNLKIPAKRFVPKLTKQFRIVWHVFFSKFDEFWVEVLVFSSFFTWLGPLSFSCSTKILLVYNVKLIHFLTMQS